MSLSSIIAFIKAFPLVVKQLDAIVGALNALVVHNLQSDASESQDAVSQSVRDAQRAETKEQLREAARKLSNIK